MNIHRIHYIFSGSVQEVGFRTTAFRKAVQLGVKGWVRNLCDGTVEMEAQGTWQQLDELLSALKEQLFIMVEDINSEEIAVIDEDSFHIR